jgi:hypothetical protein
MTPVSLLSSFGGCTIAGLPAQLLCLVDGSQFCRPFRPDGSVDLVDLAVEDVASCGPCRRRHYFERKSTVQSAMRCPTKYGPCGDDDGTVLICHYIDSLHDTDVNDGNVANQGQDLCVSASIYPTLFEIDFADPRLHDHNANTCGCCDGFDPAVNSVGQCPSPGSIDSFNDCCNPCREQVPTAYRPCCCKWSENCKSDPTLISQFGYENCDNTQTAKLPNATPRQPPHPLFFLHYLHLQQASRKANMRNICSILLEYWTRKAQ